MSLLSMANSAQSLYYLSQSSMFKKRVKGWIKNNVSGSKQSFLMNPTSLSYGRGAVYQEISSPGMSYPNHSYVGGKARVIPVELLLIDNPSTGAIEEQITFLEQCLPPERNVAKYTKPPELTFCLGSFVKKCVLEEMNVQITKWNNKGVPVMAKITLQLRQVGV